MTAVKSGRPRKTLEIRSAREKKLANVSYYRGRYDAVKALIEVLPTKTATKLRTIGISAIARGAEVTL